MTFFKVQQQVLEKRQKEKSATMGLTKKQGNISQGARHLTLHTGGLIVAVVDLQNKLSKDEDDFEIQAEARGFGNKAGRGGKRVCVFDAFFYCSLIRLLSDSPTLATEMESGLVGAAPTSSAPITAVSKIVYSRQKVVEASRHVFIR